MGPAGAAAQGPTGATGATGAPGSAGATGEKGPAGTEGQLRIYGDGSRGAFTVTSPGTTTFTDSTDLQFTNLTVNAGTTLLLESGTIIRCTGKLINNGTILVGVALFGAYQATEPDAEGSRQMADPGISLLAAGLGEVGDSSAIRAYGRGGQGLSEGQAQNVLRPGVKGGGGGANGGRGGGTVTILALGGINISASGVINADGGAGGGGIIHLIAPQIDNVAAGATDRAGAFGGSNSNALVWSPRQGGGGGGASGGNGGHGGWVPVGGAIAPGAASSGIAGHVILTSANPTSLF